MKNKLLPGIILATISNVAIATNYYFSSTIGNDTRTPKQARSKKTPWKSLSKLNAFFPSLQPGDSVLFARGEVFTGSINVQKSGIAGKPIVFAAYGSSSANLPFISGLQTLSGWVNNGNGIWSSNCSACGTTVNTVLMNGNAVAMGRFPNANATNGGYLNYETHTGNTKITDYEISSSTIDWTGAELVLRLNRWTIDRNRITLHSGNEINFVPSSTYIPVNNFGYFIQNSLATLNAVGEWYYSNSSIAADKKLYFYFGNLNPTTNTIQASFSDNLAYLNGKSYIVFNNLHFLASNKDAISAYIANNITISNCKFSSTGQDAIYANNLTKSLIDNNVFFGVSNDAINLINQCHDITIRNNTIRNTGLKTGMGDSGNEAYEAIVVRGSRNIIQYNTIDSVGYNGINFIGDSISVLNNSVSAFNLIKDDGGGIYTWTGEKAPRSYINRKIIGNIVLNGVGAPKGTDEPGSSPSHGIYLDDNSGFVEVSGNTVANCSNMGVFIHNSHDIQFTKNTIYNNNVQLRMSHDNICPSCYIVNNTVSNNILLSKKINQLVNYFKTTGNEIYSFGRFDSNYYCRPFDDNFIHSNAYVDGGVPYEEMCDLQIWQSKYNKDLASKKSPLKLPYYTVSSIIGENKYTNGTFNSNVNGLYSYSAFNNTKTEWVNDKLDAGALKFSFTNTSGQANVSKIIVGVGALTAGKKYLLRYSLLGSNNGKIMNLFLRQSLNPFNKLSEISYCKINSTRSENEFLFTASFSESDASIIFEIDESDGAVWLDNIQLQEVNVNLSNPDNLIRFEYNPTKLPKTIALNGNYRDVKNNSYSGSITLSPYTSIILLPDPGFISSPVSNFNQKHQTISDKLNKIEFNVFPNPAENILKLSLNSTIEQTVQCTILDLTGNLVKSNVIDLDNGENLKEVNIEALSAGSYLIRLNSVNTNIQKLFIKSM